MRRDFNCMCRQCQDMIADTNLFLSFLKKKPSACPGLIFVLCCNVNANKLYVAMIIPQTKCPTITLWFADLAVDRVDEFAFLEGACKVSCNHMN